VTDWATRFAEIDALAAAVPDPDQRDFGEWRTRREMEQRRLIEQLYADASGPDDEDALSDAHQVWLDAQHDEAVRKLGLVPVPRQEPPPKPPGLAARRCATCGDLYRPRSEVEATECWSCLGLWTDYLNATDPGGASPRSRRVSAKWRHATRPLRRMPPHVRTSRARSRRQRHVARATSSSDSGSDSELPPAGQAVCPVCSNLDAVRHLCRFCDGRGYVDRQRRNDYKRGER
jgi:hypothetical protein